jgi:predicted GTPase
MRKRVIICGASGRDHHDFLVLFRDNPEYEVVCFTATQIPFIEKRLFPASLAGHLYPKGIPTYSEELLPALIKKYNADFVYLAYSDLSHQEVMQKAAIVMSAGATFVLESPRETMIESSKPIISVCAVRTGCGKSAVSRHLIKYFKSKRKKVVAVRHPMAYGDLEKQSVQRFATFEDLEEANCTIEEREEYEPHILNGAIVYAGVDYKKILRKAEKEADIIIWDGGNNDTPFFKPDIHIVLTDPHRPGHELSYYPGLTNLKMADIVVINKIKTAKKQDIETVRKNIKSVNRNCKVIKSDLKIWMKQKDIRLKNKAVICLEDGPTTTHGGVHYGVAYLYAKKHGAIPINVSRYGVGSIKDMYKKFKGIDHILPALGYSKKQLSDLKKTINNAKADYVIDGSPFDLRKLLEINKEIVEVEYGYEDMPGNSLTKEVQELLKKKWKR